LGKGEVELAKSQMGEAEARREGLKSATKAQAALREIARAEKRILAIGNEAQMGKEREKTLVGELERAREEKRVLEAKWNGMMEGRMMANESVQMLIGGGIGNAGEHNNRQVGVGVGVMSPGGRSVRSERSQRSQRSERSRNTMSMNSRRGVHHHPEGEDEEDEEDEEEPLRSPPRIINNHNHNHSSNSSVSASVTSNKINLLEKLEHLTASILDD